MSKFAFLLTVDVVLSELSVSGRKSYAPKAWAFVDLDGQQSEAKIKLRVTKRAKESLVALGNGAEVKAKVKAEVANEQRTFKKKGETKKVEYYETVTEWTIVSINEVIEQGTMPKARTTEDAGQLDESDVLPD